MDRTTKYWNLNTGELVKTLHSPVNATSAALSPLGNFSIVGYEDASVLFKDHTNKISVNIPRQHSQSISAIDVSRDGQLILSGSLDNTAKLFALPNMQIIQSFTYHTDNITSVAISPDKK